MLQSKPIIGNGTNCELVGGELQRVLSHIRGIIHAFMGTHI